MDFDNIASLIKMLAVDSVQSGNPCTIETGKVIAVNPLQIQINQKIILQEDQLILSPLVREWDLDVSVDFWTVEDNFLKNIPHAHPHAGTATVDTTHKHEVKGRKTLTIHLALEVGEMVLLQRVQGGQRFVVEYRLTDPKTTGEKLS